MVALIPRVLGDLEELLVAVPDGDGAHVGIRDDLVRDELRAVSWLAASTAAAAGTTGLLQSCVYLFRGTVDNGYW